MRSWIENQYLREQLSEKNTGPDFYYDENGKTIFTEHYLTKRGSCCGSGCKHCPYVQKHEKDSTNLAKKT